MNAWQDPYEGLSDAQRVVVGHTEGNLGVFAVSGAGKTRSIVNRVARMVCDGHDPDLILATTFTKKAAGEMNERLASLGCPVKGKASNEGARIGTFHSVCLEIIRDESPWANYEVDAKNKMRSVLKQDILGFRGMNWQGVDLTEVESFISTCKNNLINSENAQHPDHRFVEAYQRYEAEREERGLITFDDMLFLAVLYLKCNQDAFGRWAHRYEHVIVDEFQDSNKAQFELMTILATGAKSLVVVGDDDQAIYEFRGAIPQYMIDFQKVFGAEIIRMEINYRSRLPIVEAANKVIKNNEVRITKTAIANRQDDATVVFDLAFDCDAEASLVCERILELQQDGYKWGDFTILYRTNAQSRAFEEVFLNPPNGREPIPHVVIGGIDFYSRKEVVDLLSYLKLAVDSGNDVAFRRAVNRPFRYIGKKTLEQIARLARSRSMLDATRQALNTGELRLNRNQTGSLKKFVSIMDRIIADFKAGTKLSSVLTMILQESGYENWILRDEGSDTSENSRLANIRELIRTADRFKTARSFLKHLRELTKEKKKRKQGNGNMVQLMSIHKSKGLEFPIVFLAGAAENILPHGLTENVEEERRLCYVAMTRAKEHLYISAPQVVLMGGQLRELEPSRFLAEAGLFKRG